MVYRHYKQQSCNNSTEQAFYFQLKGLFITTYKDAPIAGLQYLLEYHMRVLFEFSVEYRHDLVKTWTVDLPGKFL